MGSHLRERHDFVRILEITPNDRQRIELAIEMLIQLLDQLDPDPDLEPCDFLEEDADFEPTMGSLELHPRSSMIDPFAARGGFLSESRREVEASQERWAAGHVRPDLDEAEFVDEDGGDVLDEPHDGDFDDELDFENEPCLGWGFHEDQASVDWIGRWRGYLTEEADKCELNGF